MKMFETKITDINRFILLSHVQIWPAHSKRSLENSVGFEVITAVSTKMALFCVVAPCSLVEVYQPFRGPCCLIALMMEAERTSETLVNFYQTIRRYNPGESHLLRKFSLGRGCVPLV
jgi:hypothetical protein